MDSLEGTHLAKLILVLACVARRNSFRRFWSGIQPRRSSVGMANRRLLLIPLPSPVESPLGSIPIGSDARAISRSGRALIAIDAKFYGAHSHFEAG